MRIAVAHSSIFQEAGAVSTFRRHVESRQHPHAEDAVELHLRRNLSI
jgi:hypothetical protein